MLGNLLCKLRNRLPHYEKVPRFAEDIGCTVEHYRRIEAGKAAPSKRLMGHIIRKLEVSRDQADGLWVAWGIDSIPRKMSRKIMILRRNRVVPQVMEALHKELILMYDVSPEDMKDLRKVVEETLHREEIPWRA